MAEKKTKTNLSSGSKIKKKLGSSFNALSSELKASSRRVQLYGEIILGTIIESGIYPDDTLCTKSGAAAFKNALRYYNIGITSLKDAFDGTTDLDGMSDSFKAHVELGLNIFDKAIKPYVLNEEERLYWQVTSDVLRYHHERWDGTGYPGGVVGTDIPLSARICAVCNLLENLTTSNADRDKMTNENAAEEISRYADTYFDPLVIKALNKSVDKINETLENGAVAKATAGNSTVRSIEQLYRPVYNYGDHAQYGFDTDIRLNDVELGVVPSRSFLPIAERSDKINELAKWSLEEACNAISYLKTRRRFSGELFVFLSVKSLTKKNFIDNIHRLVTKLGVEPCEICLRLSENIFSYNIDTVAEAIRALGGLGFKLALGGGEDMFNLSVLQKLEVDYMFLSPELCADILVSTRAKNIVGSLIELANKLNITVIADGVANRQQAKELYSMGAEIMCGPHYGRFTAVNII